MSIIKLITTVTLAVALITMITSNSPSIYALPTTEDDGWTEGDYEGSSEEQEEQAQEDWEDAGRPGETDDDDNENNDDDNDNDDGLVECEDRSLVETEELCEQSEVLVTCSDGLSAATQAECPSVPTAAQEQLQTCQDGSVVSVNEACPEPETLTCPDGSTVSVDEDCPPTDKPLPDCDGSFQDCITQSGFVCPAGSAAHECELPESVSRELPDNDCLFDTELPECAPDANGKCPDGFGTNEDGRCFVIHSECPDGYHGHEDDETGECISDRKSCEKGYVKTDDGKNCERSSNYWCERNPVLKECYDKDNKKNDNNKNGGSSSKSSSSSKTTIINSNTDNLSRRRL